MQEPSANGLEKLKRIAEKLPAKLPEDDDQAGKPQVVPRPLQGTSRDRPPIQIRPIEEYQPFPLATLPAPLAALAAEGSEVMQCDAALITIPGLCVMASLIGNTRILRLRSDWYEPAILWGATIAESGSIKTPGWSLATSYLNDLQEQYFDKYEEQERGYAIDLQKWEVKAKKAREADEAGVWTALADKPQEPKLRRCLVGDITVEKLFEVLADNPRGLLLTQDELSNWFSALTRYRAGKHCSDLPHYLSIYSGRAIYLDRKTGERRRLYVPRPALSICGSIQPGTLGRAMTIEFLESGGAARFLLAMPPRVLKTWSEEEVKEQTMHQYHQLLAGLAELQPDLSRIKAKKFTPVVCKLNKGAKRKWIDWFNGWAGVQYHSEGALAAAYAKLEAVAARIALVHHVAGCVQAGRQTVEIGEQSMTAGIVLARWFAAEARRVYAAVAQTPDQQRACELLDLVKRHEGRMTARDLQHTSGQRYPTAEDAKKGLQQLVDAGFGRWVKVPSGQKGGRPKEEFRLTTELQNRHNP